MVLCGRNTYSNRGRTDAHIPHYGFDRHGNWATGSDAPHIGWEVGRKNSVVGHILLDDVPTGRDYAYSDLRIVLQKMIRGSE